MRIKYPAGRGGAAPLFRLCRRGFALLLCLSVCLSLLPLDFSAAATEEEIVPPTTQTVSVTASASDEQPLSAGSETSNTYMMEVSTGSVRGGGTADCVKYFVIYYTTGNGETAKRRSTVVFPEKDGLRKSNELANSIANRDSRRNQVAETFGYTTGSMTDVKGLGDLHCDQIIFTTPEPVTTIDRIQIFGRVEEYKDENGNQKVAPSSWACQTMHISRVDKIYGLEMYGWYSDESYIDYEGEVIADVVMPNGGGIFHWNNSAGVFNIQGPGVTSGEGVTLVNTQTAESYGKPNFVGTKHTSQVGSRVVFRMDMADIGDGGLECLAGSYEAGYESKISELKYCEAGVLTIRYEDIYGGIRKVNLPMVINSLGWTMEKLSPAVPKGDVAIAGFAQQGDSIPISAMLPDFKRIAWTNSEGPDSAVVEIAIGESKAREIAGLQTLSSADKSIRPDRVAKADKEMLAYTCVALYQDVGVKINHDSASIRYEYQPGASEPFLHITAGGVEGVDLDAGTTSKLPLSEYQSGMSLLPKERRDFYLITISTDNVENAGTLGEIRLQFRYTNMQDKEVTSDAYVVKDYVKQFYGEWPGSTPDFAYQYGLRPGGTIQFLIPLNGVKRFETVSVKVDGGDEWQFKGIEIRGPVKSVSPRNIRWEEIAQEVTKSLTLRSHVRISRDVVAPTLPVFSVGQIYDDAHPIVDPQDPAWRPGNLVQDDGEYHTFNGSNIEVGSSEPFDWENYRNYMTYEDTLQDLGFTKERCMYEVIVKVAGDKVNANDDDCGSANLFYFQLLFEYGNSGCVLANQQLQADAFRTGAEATFYIPTTQDYGDLSSIRIIPDDQDSNGDIYDKLKIEYIKVRKQSTTRISPTWTADSDSPDGLGWVGIDYQDPGAAGSNRGVEGRTISEISHTFEITKTSYSTKLLIAITTGSYETNFKPDADGNMVQIDDPILETGMTMSYRYYDNQGRPRAVDPIDIIEKMNEYAGLESKRVRTIDGNQENVDYVVSNKDYQFRPGKTDNFYIDVDDISQIVNMQLQIRSSVVTKWNISNISVYLVQGPGSRYINGNGEYDFKYPDGQGLAYICSWNRPQSLTKDIQIYRTPSEDDSIMGSSIATVNVNFDENSFPLGDEDTWTARVTREPTSKDDTLNLFLYPSTESAATNPENYSLSAEVLYTDTLTHSAMRIKSSSMAYAVDSNNRPVFYAIGLNASYFESFTGVEVRANSIRSVHAPISYGILQRVRNGVLIDSYYLQGPGNADIGVTLSAMERVGGQNLQRVLLQVDSDTPAQELIPEEKDLAVAVYFTTNDPYSREIRSRYIYLTDQGYSSIRPEQVLELDLGIDNLKEITAINLVCAGRLSLGLEHAMVLEQNPEGAVLNKWSIRGRMSPTRTPARFDVTGIVSLLDLDLKTALSEGTVNSGTKGPIRMTVGYLDRTGNLMTITYENIRNYIGSQNAFQAGNTDHVRLLVPDMVELRWVELEPLSQEENAEIGALWKLESLAAMVDLSGYQISRYVDTLIQEGEPLRVSLAEILLAGTITTITAPDQLGNVAGDYVIPTGGSLDVVLNAGEGVRVVPKIQGSTESVTITLNRLDPVTGGLGRPDLSDTRGYTRELLDTYAATAESKSYWEEASFWRNLEPDDGTWQLSQSYNAVENRYSTDYVVFMPPRNYTGSSISYRITITSMENDAASVYVNLTVPSEPNLAEQMAQEARARDQEYLDTHEHTLEYVAAKAPTCVNPGNTEYYRCTGCGKYFKDLNGRQEITDPKDTVVPATGNHSYGAYLSDKNGQHSRICAVCGEKLTTECTFSWTSDNAYTHTGVCTICGYETTKAHCYDGVEMPPNETYPNGFIHYTCRDCGATYDEDSHEETDPGDDPGPETGNDSGSEEPADPTPSETNSGNWSLPVLSHRKEMEHHVR